MVFVVGMTVILIFLGVQTWIACDCLGVDTSVIVFLDVRIGVAGIGFGAGTACLVLFNSD